MVQDELVRGVIHKAHQFAGFLDDGRSVSPGEDGRKEPGNLDIRLLSEPVRDADRVIGDKSGLIIFFYFSIEEFVQCIRLDAICDGGGHAMACFRFSIRSSTSSMPTLRRIRESSSPLRRRSSRAMEAWVMLAGWLISDSTPPRLSARA